MSQFSLKSIFPVALMMLVAVGCGKKETQVSESIRYVKVAVVEVDSSSVLEEFSGVVRELDDVKLSFRISGPIADIVVKEGQYVKKGSLLAVMDKRDYQLQYNAIEAEYEKTIGEIERLEKLYGTQSLTDNDYEKALAGKRQITAKFESAKNALADTRLVAPFDGYVQTLFVSKNETIAAGMPVVSIVNVSGLIIEVDIPSNTYIRKDQFDRFSCRVHNFPDDEMPVSFIGIAAKPNRSNLYTMQLHLTPRPDSKIAPGMSAMVSVFYKSVSLGTPKIPLSACFSENDKTYLWMFDSASGTLSKREIELGAVDLDNNVRVEAGLSGGETIVAAGVHSVQEGVAYKPVQQ